MLFKISPESKPEHSKWVWLRDPPLNHILDLRRRGIMDYEMIQVDIAKSDSRTVLWMQGEMSCELGTDAERQRRSEHIEKLDPIECRCQILYFISIILQDKET